MARNKTGILELDEMLRGGFMDKDAVMVAGSAGTGKTTLALEYLVNGATQFGEPGIYLTFEQLPDQIYRDAENFGWDLRKLEAENKLRVVCTGPDLLLEPEAEEQLLGETIKELKPRRMVIDSLNHLEMYVPRGDLRKEAYRILMYTKTRGNQSPGGLGSTAGSRKFLHDDTNRHEFSHRLSGPAEIRGNRLGNEESDGGNEDEG